MKRFLTFVVLVSAVLTSPINSDSATIDIISQVYSGHILYYEELGGEFNTGFWSETSSTGISEPLGHGGAYADIGGSTISMIAWTAPFVEDASVYAEVLFRSIGGSNIKIDIADGYSSGLAYGETILMDYTTNETLFQLIVYNAGYEIYQAFPGLISDGFYWWSDKNFVPPPVFSGLIPVDPSHYYVLRTSVLVTSFEEAWASVNMSVVPEPLTILLLGLGLLGLAGLRKIVQNRR